MEFAIPFIALAGAYIISNQETNNNQNTDNYEKKRLTDALNREEFTNMGKKVNSLPNQDIPPQNYPVTNVSQLVDTVREYPNPNTATDKYFNQNYYQQKVNKGDNVGNEIQDIYSLSGNYLDTEQFKHNNMVPFYGGKIKGQIYNMNMNQTILDNMNGSGSQMIEKVEQAPLFKPEKNINWAHGTPNWSDFLQSRVNPGMNNANVKPFQTENVGPGLGKGYTTEGSGGYNSGMEDRNAWLPKTVNELRVTTNPKMEYTYENLEGPAYSHVQNLGIIGKTEKYRPDTFFIQNQDRWLTTTGQEKGQMLRPIEEVQSNTNRNSTTQSYIGNASLTKNSNYVKPNIEPSKRTETVNNLVNHCNAVSRTSGEDRELYYKSHTNYENNRSTIRQPDTIRNSFTQAIGAVVAPFMDILRPTRKEEYGDNIKLYGGRGKTVPNTYVKTEGDNVPVTIKQTTLFSPDTYIGNQSSSQQVLHNQQPIANQRDTTNCGYIGNAMGANVAPTSQEANYRQNNNDKLESTQVSYQPHGSHQIFNPTINVCSGRIDSDRENPRMWAPNCSNIAQLPISKEQYGSMKSKQCYSDNDINVVRIQPDILNAFKNNPYTQSLESWG